MQRITVGLVAILGRLSAEANWRRIGEELWPITDGLPSTPPWPCGVNMVGDEAR